MTRIVLPLENYRKNRPVGALMAEWLEGQFPEQFEAVRQSYRDKLAAIDNQIAAFEEEGISAKYLSSLYVQTSAARRLLSARVLSGYGSEAGSASRPEHAMHRGLASNPPPFAHAVACLAPSPAAIHEFVRVNRCFGALKGAAIGCGMLRHCLILRHCIRRGYFSKHPFQFCRVYQFVSFHIYRCR